MATAIAFCVSGGVVVPLTVTGADRARAGSAPFTCVTTKPQSVTDRPQGRNWRIPRV